METLEEFLTFKRVGPVVEEGAEVVEVVEGPDSGGAVVAVQDDTLKQYLTKEELKLMKNLITRIRMEANDLDGQDNFKERMEDER